MAIDRDTTPAPFDMTHSRSRSAASIVDSPLFKIITQSLTAGLLSICAWGLNYLGGELGKINTAIQTFTTSAAVNELRMQGYERDNARQDREILEHGADVRTLQDKQAAITFRLDSLRQRTGERNP